MSAYPTTTQLIGSTQPQDAGIKLNRAVSGKPRLHRFYSQVWTTFVVVHEVYEAAKEALEDHFDANADTSFSFVWQGDGQTYTVMYTSAPQKVPIEGNLRWRVTNNLVVI